MHVIPQNPSPAGDGLFPELSSIGDTEEESALDFGCVSDSGRGSGAVAGHSVRSALCSLQTGRAVIQKQGTHAFHILQSPPPSLEMSLLYLIALCTPYSLFLLITSPHTLLLLLLFYPSPTLNTELIFYIWKFYFETGHF